MSYIDRNYSEFSFWTYILACEFGFAMGLSKDLYQIISVIILFIIGMGLSAIENKKASNI